MHDDLDFELAGRFIHYELDYHPDVKDISKLARRVGVDRGVIHKFVNGFPGTRAGTLRRIEEALDLPEYAIDLVREHDLDELRSSGLADRPMRWLVRQVDAAAGDATHKTAGKRNHRAG